MLTSADLARAVTCISAQMAVIRDQLNEADAKLGDGDTGMTVARIVESWQSVRAGLPADVGAALTVYGRECARASGASLGAVVAIGLSAAARAARGRDAVDRGGIVQLLVAATDAITLRSGAVPGDKTILDSLLAIHAALEAATASSSLVQTAVAAAASALAEFQTREARLGRARMYGAKSMGLDDPGMLAVYLLLRTVIDLPAR